MVIQNAVAAGMLAAVLPLAAGQAIIDPASPRLAFTREDVVLLDAAESRRDMNCEVFVGQAALGWDMKFHAGYEASLPVRELYGPGNTLSALLRVIAMGGNSEPVYFTRWASIPAIHDGSGDISLFGSFDLGEGTYHVDWMMRDAGGRLCSAHWNVHAALARKNRNVAIALPPRAIRHSESERFQAEPRTRRAQESPLLRVKILINVAPQRPEAITLDPQDRLILAALLRNLARDPRVGRISLVAFNIQQRRILYREDAEEQLDLPAMGAVLKKLNLGVVDVNQLKNKNGDAEFLSALVRGELSSRDRPDGVIFAGPKSTTDACIPRADLQSIGKLEYPVFNLTYSADSNAILWPDAVGKMVKFFKGAEYTITGPQELWNAVTDAIDRMARGKQALQVLEPAAPALR